MADDDKTKAAADKAAADKAASDKAASDKAALDKKSADEKRAAADKAAAEEKAAADAEADRLIKLKAAAEENKDLGSTASQDPSDVANAAHGVEARSSAAAKASGGRGDGRPLTKLEAAVQSSVDTVSPKSQTVQNMDAEMRQDLSTDVLTSQREQIQKQARENGDVSSLQDLSDAHDRVADAQRKVDDAIRERDAARTAYDRVAEAQSTNVRGPDVVVGEYLEAMNKRRDQEASLRNAQNAAALKAGAPVVA